MTFKFLKQLLIDILTAADNSILAVAGQTIIIKIYWENKIESCKKKSNKTKSEK
jgi:hypothetical protein